MHLQNLLIRGSKLRIIAGKAKGRNIAAVATSTRPTSDRAREALFSTLTSEFGTFTNLNVLDLYAGTGAIALESLSRGAAVVHAVENNEQAQKCIVSNYEAIKSAQFEGSFHLYNLDVTRFLRDRPTLQYHFVYIDPPYDAEDLDVVETLIHLQTGEFLDPQALIAIERNSRVKEISWPSGYVALREKNYGQATIFYATPVPIEPVNG
jgi:16S rRNA (guanine966-N2)-methyltransferase|tara:strand:- start:4094 stop:4717 length:624 start_codon:yes stop_codon:yes gene_type:complete